MGRIFGILLFVLALWFMANQYTGGGFAAGADPEERVQPTTERVRESVLRAQEESDERRRKLLGE